MGQVGDGTVVAPFANEAMRLLREDWKGKYGSKMLAEELFPILQTGIPQPDQNFQNFITINAGDTDSFAQLIDKFGNKLYEITAADGLKPIEPPGYPPPKLRPRIEWAEHSISVGDSLSSFQLDAVALDPETGEEVPGVYVYDPPSGTTFGSAGTSTLYVNFTPTDGVKYRRAMGSTVLTVVGGGGLRVPDITWADPADIDVGTALSGTQLNAVATDPISHVPVPGVFTYIPPSGTILPSGPSQSLEADFVPTDTGTYDNNSGFVAINVRHLGAHMKITVNDDLGSTPTNKAFDLLFSSPTASDTCVHTSILGDTYTVDFDVSYDIGTGHLLITYTLTPSVGTIFSGANPAPIDNNVGSGVNSLQAPGSGTGWEVHGGPPVSVTLTAVPHWVSWIDS